MEQPEQLTEEALSLAPLLILWKPSACLYLLMPGARPALRQEAMVV